MNEIKTGIVTGIYKPGDKLCSVQSLTKKLGINADTVIRAYKLLEEEHFIYSVPRSGYYVVKSALTSDGNGIIDMIHVRPPSEINPYKDFNHCMKKSAVLYDYKLYEYASPEGMEELRRVVCKYLANSHVITSPENIVITSGAQQALYILANMEFRNNPNSAPNKISKILVEQPTYHLMLQILEKSSIPVIGIERNEGGVNLEELEYKFRSENIKFFYSMPRYQNPTGFCYSQKDKLEILKLAKKYGVYIVEDDYVADLEIDPKADSFYTLGGINQVIYVRSFSKTLLPGLRLGMLILLPFLKDRFINIKHLMDLNTTTITQGALEIYLKSGMYDVHLGRLKEYYRNKMKELLKLCHTYISSENEIYIPQTGIYLTLEVSAITSTYLKNKLDKEHIYVSLLEDSYIKEYKGKSGIRLCVCNAKEEELEKTIRIIGLELNKKRNRRDKII
jgi:DNA-binding transcriptional MocR family regulator